MVLIETLMCEVTYHKMDQRHLMLAALLLILFPVALIAGAHQENDQKLSPSEEHEVRDFARRFAARLEKTRDLTPYLTRPPGGKVFDEVITDVDDLSLVDKDVASKVGSYQLRRFYITMWNIGYLSESYIYGRYLLEKTSKRDLLPEQQYPAHVFRFMNRNPTVKEWWKDLDSSDSDKQVTTVAQFYSLLKTYNEAAILMRAYIRKHPPESTAIYKQNLKYLGPFLNEINVDTCASDCEGLAQPMQSIRVNLPVLQLYLVRIDGRLQVLLVGLHSD